MPACRRQARGSVAPEHARAGQAAGRSQQVDAADGPAADRRPQGRVDRAGARSSLIAQETGQLALEALWALNLVGGLDEATALKTLDHADPYVRLWTARLLCDASHVSRRRGGGAGPARRDRAGCRGPQPARLLGEAAARAGCSADRPGTAGAERGRPRHPHAALALVGHRGEGRRPTPRPCWLCSRTVRSGTCRSCGRPSRSG